MEEIEKFDRQSGETTEVIKTGVEEVLFRERLIQLRKNRGFTQKDIGDRLNKRAQTVAKWEKGTNAPTFSDLVKLVGILGVTADYLLGYSNTPNTYAYPPLTPKSSEHFFDVFRQLDDTNKDATLKFMENKVEEQEFSQQLEGQGLQEILVKQEQLKTEKINIQARAKAGATGFKVSELPIDRIDYPTPVPIHDLAFQVDGNSMEPSFYNGETIFVMKSALVKKGDIGVFKLNNRYYVKKIWFENSTDENRETHGKIILRALNHDYPDIIPEKTDDFVVIGKVVRM